MRVVVLQSNYLPWKGYFDLIHDADVFVYRDDVKYTKQDWRNRNKLYTREGVRWLTIPVAQSAVTQNIRDVRLPDPRWQMDHFRTIYHAYRAAPFFFAQLEPLLREVYIDRRWESLANVNRYLIERISTMLGIETVFLDSADYQLSGDRVTCLINLLQQLNATEYVTGPMARNYIGDREHLFAESRIRIIYKDYSGYPTYPQLREPFEHAVSIVDMLANLRLRDIPHYIWGWRTKLERRQGV